MRRTTALTLALLLLPGAALAHTGTAGGLISGLSHPILGLDHVVAMVAVGLWGSILGRPALWALPVAFPLVMAFGGVLGIAGVPLPGVETAIALSGVALGLLVAFAVRLPLAAAGALVAAFALFHGHAHGAELPAAANPLAYAAGFVIATGFLHLAGIAVGEATLRRGRPLLRALGAAIALTGGAFLAGIA
ncbi:HupE/UreJ family protein [Rubellimicrobium aerolatum]|uniref:HupE/UreJ family protein n=1 Tax=Rubellimicrobium aerolatum TaxID=490979 RepID=A0ABW0SFL4_9RHOB|nr:HupE/UreJ family protein [Rubellimicrobium aerolatum]MBP1807229.1 urease accessory protein [Rubellimicrobium aerolatum]